MYMTLLILIITWGVSVEMTDEVLNQKERDHVGMQD